jgi:LCP family protein required for cell wall assembly
VDFSDEVVWILALGSDAEDHTDAIHLVGLDIPARRAAGIGIPRDFWVDLPDGEARINEALAKEDGQDILIAEVEELVGITPQFVVLAEFDGFRDLVDTIGGVTVHADEPVPDLGVRRGPNDFDGAEALEYARTRVPFVGPGDLIRSANQQQIMMGILRQLLAREDEVGFMEGGAVAALQSLDTNLGPTELYRLAQAVTQIRPDRVGLCVLTGTDETTSGGAAVLIPNYEAAERIGADVRDDARFDGDC